VLTVIRTYLAWYRAGRMDEAEFRSVTDLLAESGMSLEHPTLGCGTLLDVAGDQVRMSCERIRDRAWER
jgi:hypothetical protein